MDDLQMPHNKQLQRTGMYKVPRHQWHHAAAELRRCESLVPHFRSVLAAAVAALAAVAAAQEPLCNPCVDGPEMFEHRPTRAPANPRAYAPELSNACLTDLWPIVYPSPEFPEYGERQLTVIVSFSLNTDGSVLTPKILEAWTLGGEMVKIPANVEKAIVDTISKWRFLPRSRPCTGIIARTFRPGP